MNLSEDHRHWLLRELEAELNVLHVELVIAARRWQLAGQDPHDDYRGLYITDAGADALLHRPLGYGWGHLVELSEDEQTEMRKWKDRAEKELSELRKQMRTAGNHSRILHLYKTFELTALEKQVFWIGLASQIDLRYERLYAYLQDDITRKRPSVNLCLDLVCPQGVARLACLDAFSPQGALFGNGLLHWIGEEGEDQGALLGRQFAVDSPVTSWLMGRYEPDPNHNGAFQLIENHELNIAPYEDRIPETVRRAAAMKALPVILLSGADEAPKEATAAYIAVKSGKPLLRVNISGSSSAGNEALLRMAARDARMLDAALYIRQAGDGGQEFQAIYEKLLRSHPGTIILSGDGFRQSLAVEGRRVEVHDFQRPTFNQRASIWRYYLENYRGDDQPESASVAAQFQLTSEQIRTAAIMAGDISAQRGEAPTERDLFTAARSYSNPGLESLARKIEPRYEWQDIVLPDDQIGILRELVNTVRLRPVVLDKWGLGKKLVSGTGVTALFSGPPGTGKTMAAEIIAGELYLDLYKIDLSTVVSKYIGETEKNLERIFSEAEFSNAILFFDEADALFGKRSEVRDSHDRYANIEISYLLQRMEAYDGVTILATNLRSNLDEAFTRRLQFAVDFPFPEIADRLRIWRALFSSEFPQAEDLDFDLLAKRFRLAGGNIRNVIVSAAYLAADDGGKITMRHLLHGTRRELQKMGRLINQEELEVPMSGEIQA